jgi:hypothetical protein
VAPLRLGGLRGKQSTPSDWLGGTGEVSTVGEQERQGARGINRGTDINQGGRKGKRYARYLVVECLDVILRCNIVVVYPFSFIALDCIESFLL